jgi:uncharacterized HAD superfamily protein
MRIGLDIDGVLYSWEKTARYMLREVLPNSPYTKDGPLGHKSTHWNYIQENVSPQDWKWLWNEGVRLGLFRHGHLFPGTIKCVRRLADMGDVVVITHRPKQAVEDTLAWLTYQRLPLAGVHILSGQEPKSSVKPLCNVYIDDKPENCDDLAMRTGASVFIMDREWNQGFARPGVRRVRDLGELVLEIEQRSPINRND